jgi:hypothetical protein
MSTAVSRTGKKTLRTLQFTPDDHVAPIVITISSHIAAESQAVTLAHGVATLLDRYRKDKP